MFSAKTITKKVEIATEKVEIQQRTWWWITSIAEMLVAKNLATEIENSIDMTMDPWGGMQ